VTGAPRTVLAIGPARGGVGHVFGQLVGALRADGWAVDAHHLGHERFPGWEALRALWRLRRRVRHADVVHVELGSNDHAAFWFLFLVVLLRRDVVSVAHDVSLKLIKSPGAALTGERGTWALRLGHRVLSPLLDAPAEAVVRRRVARWAVLGAGARTAWAPKVTGSVTVVPLGAAPPSPSAVLPSEGEYVLFAGFLSPSKGIDLLVDAWEEVGPGTDLTLWIAGRAAGPVHEPFVAALKERSAKMANPPRWLGEPDDAGFAALFPSAALVVLPYRESSAASGVLVRAIVEGRCVLATDVPAFRDAVEPGFEAVLVPAGDALALTAELASLISAPALRDGLGRAAAQHGRDAFTYAAEAEAIGRVYRGDA